MATNICTCPARFGADLGDIDVEVADRIGLALLPCRPVTLDIRQSAYPVTLQATTNATDAGSSAEAQAIVQRQQLIAPKGDDDRLLLD